MKCLWSEGQSLPPSPHPGHLERGLLASVLGLEVSVASGYPVSVSGCLVSLSGCMPSFCDARNCYKTSFKTASVQHMRATPAMGPQRRGRLLGLVGSPGTHKPAKRKRACTHCLEVPWCSACRFCSACVSPASTCMCMDCLKCRPSLPKDWGIRV